MRCIRSFMIFICLGLLLGLLCLTPRETFAKGALPQKNAAPVAAQKTEREDPKSAAARMRFSTVGGRGVFQMSFNRRMVDTAKTDITTIMPPEDMPMTVTPPLEGEARWTDEKTLVFTSYNPLPRATTLTVESKKGITTLEGEAVAPGKWQYTPHPLTLGAYQVSYAGDGTVAIGIFFSCKVDLAKLKQALTITEGKDGKKLPFTLELSSDNGTQLFIAFIKPEKLGNVTVSVADGFTSEEGPAGISAAEASCTVKTTSMFSVNSMRARQSSSPPWERYIEVSTTNGAAMDTLKQYLEITPPTDVRIEARTDGFLILGDFTTKPRVNITLKKGAPGVLGFLVEDFTSTIIFDDFAPRMAFDSPGTILSPSRSMRVPFSSINVEKIQATLWQLPENNIPLMAAGFFDAYKKHLSRKIAVRTGAINGARNRNSENALDLAQIAGKARGVFLLTVADASDPKKVQSDEPGVPVRDEYRYGGGYDDDEGDDGRDMASPMQKLVVISDIGIVARVMPDAVTVWANSIAAAEPLKGARVRVFAANNVLLAEGRTDKDGLWRLQRSEDWSGRERPAIVVVATNAPDETRQKAEPGLSEASVTDMAYVKLESNLASDSAFDTGGRDYVRQGYEALCFTPRGVFRPGETVDFKILVRNARMRAPGAFPVEWHVRSSTGRTVGKGTAMLGAEGGAAFSLPLMASAPTGGYTMIVSLPGKNGGALGYCTFAVEDFQPPRITVALTAGKPVYVRDNDVTVTIDAKYLFGAPVEEAPWEGSVNLTARDFSHPAWRSFHFPSTFTDTRPPAMPDIGGTLDHAGNAAFTIPSGSDWTAPLMNIVANVRVREDGGRWVGRNIVIPYFTTGTLLGYEFAQKDDPRAGSPVSMRLAAVTPEGKPVDTALTATLIKIERYYLRTDKGYTQATRRSAVATKTVAPQNGSGVFTVTPPGEGDYAVEIATADGSSKITAAFSVLSGVSASEDGASPLVDRVMLSWDKQRYAIGETAALTVRSPFPGKLMVVLEAEKELFRLTLPLKETETTIRIPVLASMLPNAYCSAWVIRPVLEGEKWGSHRAYGVIPLSLDRSASKLNVTVTAPEKTLPKTAMPVAIRLADSYGQPVKGEVTLAFVDEGLLSLTNFATPDPFAFFTAKRAMLGMAFDIYDTLMPLSSRKAMLLRAGGGLSAESASLLSPMGRKLELLSIFLGAVQTDENGVAETTLLLPEYSGKGRIMAVAATPALLGSAEASVRVARDVTVEASLPRMVAPGDMFSVPVTVFSDGNKNIKATVAFEAEGPLAVAGDTKFAVTLDEKTARASLPLTIKAENTSGLAALRVTTTIEGAAGEPFVQRLEIPVRPPFPRLTRSGGGVIRGGEKALADIGGGFFPGTQRVSLSFANTPGIGLMRALDYLAHYPYGCLEQTTSSAWPYLAVPAMLQSVDPEKAGDSEFRQAVDFAVRRILSMQRSDGGFNAWPGPGPDTAAPWVSAYATHFLTEAKSTGLVPDDALQAALGWMRSYLTSPLPQNMYEVMDALSVKAYACYVLALNGDAPLGWMRFLQDQGKFLTQSARIFLAGANVVATGKADALRELGDAPFARFGRYGWSLESSPRNEALRLLMWTHADPFAPETAAFAKRVIEDGEKNRWRNTQENGMAVLAIGRYIEKTAGKSREYTATLSSAPGSGVKAQEIATFTDEDTPTFSRETLPPAPPAPPYPVSVSMRGDGTAFYSWTTSGTPLAAPEPFSEGLAVFRRWTLPDGTVYDFIPDPSGKLPETLQTLAIPHGARVTVSVYVKPAAAMNSLVLADIVPGGFDIDNPGLEPGSEHASRAGTFVDPKTGKPFDPPAGFKDAVSLNSSFGSRTEIRDDRLLLFVDHMPERAGVFTYTLRAVNKGNFLLPPVSAEDMYDPTIRALTPTARVVVE